MFLRVGFLLLLLLLAFKRDLLYKPFFCLPWESFRNECGHTREFLGMGSKKMPFVAWSVQPREAFLDIGPQSKDERSENLQKYKVRWGFRHLWERGLALSGEVWDWGDLIWLSKSECPQLTTRVVDLWGQLSFNLGQCAGSSASKTLLSYDKGVAIENKLSPQ